jgi:hypothetical protein
MIKFIYKIRYVFYKLYRILINFNYDQFDQGLEPFRPFLSYSQNLSLDILMVSNFLASNTNIF